MPFTSCAVNNYGENIISKSYSLPSFNKIIDTGYGNIYLTQGSRQDVKVRGNKEYLKYIELFVRNNCLHINYNNNLGELNKNISIDIYIVVPHIESIASEGIGNITIQKQFKDKNLYITSNGTGDITIDNFTGDNIKLTTNGTGNIYVSGDTNGADLITNGVGNITANLKCNSTIYASTTGVGSIELKGSAPKGNYICSGAGNINGNDMKVNNLTVTSSGVGDIYCYPMDNYTENHSGYGQIYNRGAKKKSSRTSTKSVKNTKTVSLNQQNNLDKNSIPEDLP